MVFLGIQESERQEGRCVVITHRTGTEVPTKSNTLFFIIILKSVILIDTIKLNVYKHVNKSFYNLCCYNSDNRLQGYIINNKTGTATKQFLWSYKKLEYDTFDMEIIKGKFTNSYNYHIHFRIFEDRIEFEFSIPKLIFGTNVLEAKGQLQKHTPYDILILGIKFFF